jgi:phosphoribosylamine-glycine ligase
VLAFFAGEGIGNALVTSGTCHDAGRARRLCEAAIARVYDAVSHVRFEGVQFRRDIGRKALATRL